MGGNTSDMTTWGGTLMIRLHGGSPVDMTTWGGNTGDMTTWGDGGYTAHTDCMTTKEKFEWYAILMVDYIYLFISNG